MMADRLSEVGEVIKARFDSEKRVLSFREYLRLFEERPWHHTRDAVRYLRDCLDHFGTVEVRRPWGITKRWRLFDLPFEESETAKDGPGTRRSDRLIGQERIQDEFVRLISNFVREGRVNRLVLMHGPNGSAKSTFVACLMRGLEHYSGLDDGALYRFSWIFPRGRDGKTIGFGSTDDNARAGSSFADLPEARIEVKLASELREHPLLLLPVEERRKLVREAYEKKGVTDNAPDWIWDGQLGSKNKQIYEALLTAYRGELERVLHHVQVERYYVSKRYRVGAVTIGPQMAVDAQERQITADLTLSSLPASLSALRLFEPYGELVDATGGILEFSDLLKRPLDAWKYLLIGIETGEVALPLSNLAINAVLVASSNELHLNAFREHHEYNSFRGRLQFIRVPYLLDYTQEQGIYDAQIVPQVRRHVAPHATFTAALWAVLSRLRRAQADRYDDPGLGRIAADLSPLEKAELYATGTLPRRLSSDDMKVLRNGIAKVMSEWDSAADYEGLSGASPREIRSLLLDAAADSERECLSPLSVLERIEAFCQRADHDYLKEAPDRGYRDARGFLRQVRGKWLDRVDEEVRVSTGLIEESQHEALFDRYVTHVSLWAKRERVYNPVTGAHDEPDTDLMARVEKQLEVEGEPEDFRHNLINIIAGHGIDHPGVRVDQSALFPKYIDKLREAYFNSHRQEIAIIIRDVLSLSRESADRIEPARKGRAERTLKAFSERFGYTPASIQDALGELLKERYVT